MFANEPCGALIGGAFLPIYRDPIAALVWICNLFWIGYECRQASYFPATYRHGRNEVSARVLLFLLVIYDLLCKCYYAYATEASIDDI